MKYDLNSVALTHKDKEEACNLLVEAFFNNPAHTYIYPDEQTRIQKMTLLLDKNLNAQFRIGRSFANKDKTGRIVSMGFWHAPHAPKANILQIIRFGFLSVLFKHGSEAFRRVLLVSKQLEHKRLLALKGQESWYLNNMVVAENYRGQGIGKKLLQSQLSDVVDPSRQLASLTTQKFRNVQFYQSLGFVVADSTPVVDGENSFKNWIMIREPVGT